MATTTTYTHPEWPEPKNNHDAGKVSTMGSFPRNWLDKQDAETLTAWGIVEVVTVVPDPTPDALPSIAERRRADEVQITSDKISLVADKKTKEALFSILGLVGG